MNVCVRFKNKERGGGLFIKMWIFLSELGSSLEPQKKKTQDPIRSQRLQIIELNDSAAQEVFKRQDGATISVKSSKTTKQYWP